MAFTLHGPHQLAGSGAPPVTQQPRVPAGNMQWATYRDCGQTSTPHVTWLVGQTWHTALQSPCHACLRLRRFLSTPSWSHTTGRRKVSAQRSRTAKATGSCAGGFSAGVVPTPSSSADAGGANGATRSELRLQSGPLQSPLGLTQGRPCHAALAAPAPSSAISASPGR